MPIKNGFLRLGRAIDKRRWLVIAAWFFVAIVLKIVAPPWSEVAMDGDLQHLPDSTTVVRGAKLSAQAFPDDRAKSQIVLVFARHKKKLSIKDRQFALDLGRSIERLPGLGVVDVWTEKTPVIGPLLRSPSGDAGRVVVRLTNEFMATDNIRVLNEVQQEVRRAQDQDDTPSGLKIGITGSAAIGGDMLTASAESVASTHRTSILLVAIALFAIYRSPWLVLVPLLTIALAASVSIDLLAILAQWSIDHPDAWPVIRIFTTTKIFVIVLLFGAGTDYCLFLASRFREQCAAGLQRSEAIATALEQVGIALAASALTTIVGLAMMGWADFGKYAYSGPAIAICLAVTLIVCLTLVPALLATRLGQAAAKTQASASWQALWQRLADGILRRPYAILITSFLLACPFAWVGWSVDVTYDLLGELDADRVSRQGTQLLRQHFPAGEIGPLVVLAKHPEGGLDSLDGRFQIAELVKPLTDLTGIAKVRSLYQPTGAPPGTTSVFSTTGLAALAAPGSPLTKAVFVSQVEPLAGKVTRLFLIPTAAPFSPEAIETCNAVEQVLHRLQNDPTSPWYKATFELLGPTAGIRDLQRVTIADRQLIQILVTIAVLLVIVVLLRKPIICCYLIVTVLFSYLMTMGITALVFQALRGEAYVGLDWKVPLFLFVILVAVGQDYNIYLVTRVLEEQRQRGLREGLRRAIIQTGGIITSCGIIMAGTFISMTTAKTAGMVELGFALSLGILLDTFLVRTILVPAFLATLIGKQST
ncbi:MAG: MMPL family transporter [Planctomycetes bacterium]|nr:MMPL family transporter [Planctomycetota bacterium]